MPHKVSGFEDQLAQCEDRCHRAPHCTWCLLCDTRQQEDPSRGRMESYGAGDSMGLTRVYRRAMRPRRKARQHDRRDAHCLYGRDSSNDEALSQKESTAQCHNRHDAFTGGPSCSHVRNARQCCRSEGKIKAAGRNAEGAGCPSTGSESPKNDEEAKNKCDPQLESPDLCMNFKQIVVETRCPCLCAYLHFTDTTAECTCNGRPRSSSLPDRDGKTIADLPDNRLRSFSAPIAEKGFSCRVAKCFSSFKKQPRYSTNRQPSPLSRETKNFVPTGGNKAVEDTCVHQELERCNIHQNCGGNDKTLKANIPRKCPQRQSLEPTGIVKRLTNTDGPCQNTATRISAEEMRRDTCAKCGELGCGVEDVEQESSRVRGICSCDSRQTGFKKLRSSLQRMCWAFSGCKRSTCTCECHEKQDVKKDDASHTPMLGEEETRGSKVFNREPGQDMSLPKRGLLTLKYEILRQKEMGCSSKQVESSSSVCKGNQQVSHCLSHPRESLNTCSCKNVREPIRKTNYFRKVEQIKSSCKACVDEPKRHPRFEAYKSKSDCRERGDGHERQGGNGLNEVITSEDEKTMVNHRHRKTIASKSRCSKRKNKLSKAHHLEEVEMTERSSSADDHSELEFNNNTRGKALKKEASPGPSRAGNNNIKANCYGSSADPANVEVVKIGNRYYQATCHRTAHIKIMSFRKLKAGRKQRKSPRIEVRLKYDTTSSDDGSIESTVPHIDPVVDTSWQRSQSLRRKSVKQRTARDKSAKPDIREVRQLSKTRHHAQHANIVMDGQRGDAPTPPVTRKFTEAKEVDGKDPTGESTCWDNVQQVPKALTEPPSENFESRTGWKSDGAQMSKKGVSARTLELKQLSERWFAGDAQPWDGAETDAAGDEIMVGTCEVRPFTASSSTS